MGESESKKVRGVFEKVPASGIWWIQYFDAEGHRRREKAGTKSNARDLYTKRKNEALQGKKLPEKLRARVVRFSELAKDAEAYCKANNQGQQYDLYRIGRLKEAFGNKSAELSVEDIRKWFAKQNWKDGTHNRYRTMLSLIFRLGMEHGKVKSNPARLLKHRYEDNGRVRFLNQYAVAETELDYLKDCGDEESRLRAVIAKKYPEHMPEFEIALNTGMRPSEQYKFVWDRVDFERRLITIPKSKNGKTRHIGLNPLALAAFERLRPRTVSGRGSVFVNMKGKRLHGYKHWFEDAVAEAGIRDFTWYCLRHTFASRLVMAGVDLRTVAELMGHKTIQMTMRYAHLAPAHQLSAVDRLMSFAAAVPGAQTGSQAGATTSATDASAAGAAGVAKQTQAIYNDVVVKGVGA